MYEIVHIGGGEVTHISDKVQSPRVKMAFSVSANLKCFLYSPQFTSAVYYTGLCCILLKLGVFQAALYTFFRNFPLEYYSQQCS